ncbi:uncharacterized protein LOC119083795 [Bradysia coprophila]|uniref:uncharacterized protein LOC119083795 n=1 Tax=Bradysia coprophila TaxID=38358 RepID=UPI00187DCADE|nr:uncharacterized protein LOC119083795 [Bradysia coprophila]
MKLTVLLALCVCLMQICSGRTEIDFNQIRRAAVKQQIREDLNGASEQFLDDYVFMGEKYFRDQFVMEMVFDGFLDKLFRFARERKTSKIDVNTVQNRHASMPELGAEQRISALENMKILKAYLSNGLPPELMNGMLNLYYVWVYRDATTEQIESALNYLYGTEPIELKTVFIDSIQLNATLTECPDGHQMYTEVMKGLKDMVDVKPKVAQDVTAIYDKFPCNDIAHHLIGLALLPMEYGADVAKINGCMIIEMGGFIGYDYRKFRLAEYILSTKLPVGTFRGIIDFVKVCNTAAGPIEDIEKTLEYYYDVVPKAKC